MDAKASPRDGEWPTFALEYTFNPRDVTLTAELDPDEVVIYERDRDAVGDRWISGKRDACVSLEEIR